MPDSPSPIQTPNRVRAERGSGASPAAAAGRSTNFTPANPPNPHDADVLARAQAGDHQAFAQLYALHKRRIYSLCLRMVGNVAEAEDLTQEAFLQLHRKIATFRGDSAFSTWLHRLAINVVLMQLRKKGLSLISLDEAMEPTSGRGPEPQLWRSRSHADRRDRPPGPGARRCRSTSGLPADLYPSRCRGF